MKRNTGTVGIAQALIGGSGVMFLIIEIFNPHRPANLWIIAGIVFLAWGLGVLLEWLKGDDR